jgi:hypothetical protein
MNKPKKRAPRVYIIEEPEVTVPAPAPKPGNRRQKWLIRIGVLLPLVLLTFTLARGARENKHLPQALLGVWQSSSQQYTDCYMEITPGTIVFGNAEHGYLLYFVSSVEESPGRGQTTYTVHYTDLDGLKYQMTINHIPGPKETLIFEHHMGGIWTRRPPT